MSLTAFANFSSSVPWGLWVAIYVWLVGISCGSYFLVMVGNARNHSALKKITGPAISLSLATLCAGLLSILVDLGHIERFPRLFLDPSFTSVMAWMVWLYNAYFVVLLVSLFRIKKGFAPSFAYPAGVFALALLLVESLLFALPPGKAWHSWIFSADFILGSIASAAAFLIFLAAAVGKQKEHSDAIKPLARILVSSVILGLGLKFVEGLHFRIDAAAALLAAVAVLILLTPSNTVKGLAGLAAGLGMLWEKYTAVVSAQMVEPYKGFREALIAPRLTEPYIPSIGEWVVALFLIMTAVAAFFIIQSFIVPLIAQFAPGYGSKQEKGGL